MDVVEAIQEGNAGRVRELVQEDHARARARDESGVSVLLLARYHGRAEIVEALLPHRPDLDVFEAAALGRTERLEQLLDEDHELVRAWSPDGFTPLHLAAFFDHPAGVRLLLERGADVEAVARNPMLVRPLHSAVAGEGHRLEIARLLLEHGADPNAKQQADFTPMHAAVQNDDVELQQLLIDHGAEPPR
jgi:ankyrin repeat protein